MHPVQYRNLFYSILVVMSIIASLAISMEIKDPADQTMDPHWRHWLDFLPRHEAGWQQSLQWSFQPSTQNCRESNTLSISTNIGKFVKLLGHQGGERNACEVLRTWTATQEAQNRLPLATSTTSSQQIPRWSLVSAPLPHGQRRLQRNNRGPQDVWGLSGTMGQHLRGQMAVKAQK